jgi:RNA polymerase sigma-70 factor, ECF subfamily
VIHETPLSLNRKRRFRIRPRRVYTTRMDEQGVRDAYQRYAGIVFARCRRLLGDAAAARDATQEVFERCFVRRDGLRDGRELLAWLYRVATNLCLNRLRDDRGRRSHEADFIIHCHSDDAGPAGPTLARELLHGFDRRTQAIVIYVYVDGMTHAEAAALSGVTDRTVRNCLARFVAKNRERLGLKAEEELG